MHLNIKSNKTYDLAATAARLTGKSLTQTVTDALNDYLIRIHHSKKLERKQAIRKAGQTRKGVSKASCVR